MSTQDAPGPEPDQAAEQTGEASRRRMPSVRRESLWVTQLELLWYGDVIGHATGFFYSFGKTLGLVTNWHVFANRHAVTDIHFRDDRKVPNEVRFTACVIQATLNKGGITAHAIHIREFRLPLITDDRFLWWQHFGYVQDNGEPGRVDIAVLPLSNEVLELAEGESILDFTTQVVVMVDENLQPVHCEHAYPRVGADVFILGYPLGLVSQGIIPIWKRGSIASEPLAHLNNNLPVFLVDSVTRNGMSGSPILYFGNDLTTADGGALNKQHFPPDQAWLVGIHAGSRGSSKEELEMTLSRAWKRPLIDEVFMHGMSANAKIDGIDPSQSAEE